MHVSLKKNYFYTSLWGLRKSALVDRYASITSLTILKRVCKTFDDAIEFVIVA